MTIETTKIADSRMKPEFEFLIYRHDGFNVTHAVLLKASTDDTIRNDEELLEALKEGVQHWVKNTDAGKHTYAHAGSDMNIADLKGEDLTPIIAQSTGILSLEIVDTEPTSEWTYDTHICDELSHNWLLKGWSEDCPNCDGARRPSCPMCDGTNIPQI